MLEPGSARPGSLLSLAPDRPNLPFGQGETPIKEVLALPSQNKWDIPANIEYECRGDDVAEVRRCVEYCKQALA
jgi:hypothetical protein